MNKFITNSTYFETETGDKILYPFGPPIFQTEVDSDFTKKLLEEGLRLSKKDKKWDPKLAGDFLVYGKPYDFDDDFVLKCEPYLKTFVEKFFNGLYKQLGNDFIGIDKLLFVQNDRRQLKQGDVRLDTMWINFSKKHDFIPPHSHTGILSFIIYIKIPEEIFDDTKVGGSQKQAGQIVFNYGDNISMLQRTEFSVKPYENLMFIFPNHLRHYVPVYFKDAERISVSGNFIVI